MNSSFMSILPMKWSSLHSSRKKTRPEEKRAIFSAFNSHIGYSTSFKTCLLFCRNSISFSSIVSSLHFTLSFSVFPQIESIFVQVFLVFLFFLSTAEYRVEGTVALQNCGTDGEIINFCFENDFHSSIV